MREYHLLSKRYLLDCLNKCNCGHLTIEAIGDQYISVTISPIPEHPKLSHFARRHHWYPQQAQRLQFFSDTSLDDDLLAQAYDINNQQNTLTL